MSEPLTRTAVIGHVEWTHLIALDNIPAQGQIVESAAWMELAAGGACAAAVQLVKLTGHCDFFTAVGDDHLGVQAVAQIEERGVTVHAARRPGPTRRALVLTDSTGERTIVVHGTRLFPRLDDRLPWELLNSADSVLFTAGDSAALHAARGAATLVVVARGVPTALNVDVDAVVGSGEDIEEVSALNPSNRARLVVATHGHSGGTFRTANGKERTFPASTITGQIVDRYGAGDSFAAGLTFALGLGRSPEEAVGIAARCGAAVLSGHGPYETQLTWDDLQRSP